MDLPPGLPTRLRHRFDKVVFVHIAKEDVVALVATAHHMIHGARVF